MITVQSLWIGESLSELEALCIRSFLHHGHSFHLYTYENVGNIPEGTVIRDASEIIPKDLIYRVRDSLAIFSDQFRWELLCRQGGCWVDMDMICLQPFDFEEEVVFGLQGEGQVATGVLIFPQGHPIACDVAETCRHPHRVLPWDTLYDRCRKWVNRNLRGNRREHLRWGESGGPKGLTRVLKYGGILDQAQPAHRFYPVEAPRWKAHFDGTFRNGLEEFSDSHSTHLWNEILTAKRFQSERSEMPINKNGPFIEGSFIDQMMRRYQ
ncbi:MAG: hypothetical protein CBC13_00335 [Planctomycetia bacterium TMED53]|nr:MAG: hypothetical protein CBC13_00335 [Planctomycetia bacterium TMED53]